MSRAIPPYEIRRDDAGYAVAISRGGWDVIHVNGMSVRTAENIDAVVARLNAAPLDWPLRHNGRKRRVYPEKPGRGAVSATLPALDTRPEEEAT